MIDFRDSKIYKKSYEKSFLRLTDVGLDSKSAHILADSFAVSDCFGVQTHGSGMLDIYIDKVQHNFFNLHPSFRIKKKTNAFTFIDGDNAIGAVSACHCLNVAMEEAKREGIHTVFSNNNNTFGAAFYYSLLAAEKGYICFITSNSPAQMALPNSKTKILGTNPFAVVFPTNDGCPIIVDMASSAVAKSKIREYKENNKLLPDGWALDKDGKPTNDPEDALNGFVLPMSGFKGCAIALSIDIIAGFLSGSSYLNNVGHFLNADKGMNIGFMLTVFDPEFITEGMYFKEFNNYINNLRFSDRESKPILPGDDRISFYYKNR